MQPTMGTQPGHSLSSQVRVKKEKPWEVGGDQQSCMSGHGHGENLRSSILFKKVFHIPVGGSGLSRCLRGNACS